MYSLKMCSDEEFWSPRTKLKPPDICAVLLIYGLVFSPPALSSGEGCIASVRSGELPMALTTEYHKLVHECTGSVLQYVQSLWMAALLHLLQMVCCFSNSMYMQICVFTLYYACTGMRSYRQQQVTDMCRFPVPEVVLTSLGSRYRSSIKLSLLLCCVAAVRPATALTIDTFTPILMFKAPVSTFNFMQRLTLIIFPYGPVIWMCISSSTMKYHLNFLMLHHIWIKHLDTLLQISSRPDTNLSAMLVNNLIK